MKVIIATTAILANLITKEGVTLKLSKGKIPKVGDKLYITGAIKPCMTVKRGKTGIILYTVLSLEESLVCKDEFYLRNDLMPKTKTERL